MMQPWASRTASSTKFSDGMSSSFPACRFVSSRMAAATSGSILFNIDIVFSPPALLAEFLFQFSDLVEALLVASSLEGGFQPRLDDPLGRGGLRLAPGQHENVRIVVLPGKPRRLLVETQGCPDAGELVGHDRHPHAGAADEDPLFEFARRDAAGRQDPVVGIVHGLVA